MITTRLSVQLPDESVLEVSWTAKKPPTPAEVVDMARSLLRLGDAPKVTHTSGVSWSGASSEPVSFLGRGG